MFDSYTFGKVAGQKMYIIVCILVEVLIIGDDS